MKTPVATYRVQLSKAFGFAELEDIVPYLSKLGISHIYASPIFQARAGSTHGYDIVDPNTVNPELGGQTAFEHLSKTVTAYGLEWLQDIVPNHQAYSLENKMIFDLMQNGPSSRYSSFFDVNWNHPEKWLNGKILAPFLQQTYRECLKQGLISLVKGEDGLRIRYGGMYFPFNSKAAQKTVPKQVEPDCLDELLGNQFYALSHWREALKQINYRRFFDITDLIGVRVEDPEVFDFVHRLIFRLAMAGQVSALRVDHVDGLYNPEEYLNRLRRMLPDAYIIVEKILTGKEQLPDSWPVQGTTGYDFLNRVNKVFIQQTSEDELDCFYRKFTGTLEAFGELLYNCKKTVIESSFLGDVKNAARLIQQTLGAIGFDKNLSASSLEAAVVEVAACFPVYRTYISAGKHDVEAFEAALQSAKQRNPQLTDALESIDYLLGKSGSSQEALHAVMKLQQFTSAVMAKGYEDTAFYRYCRFLSLNDVGGDPAQFGCSPADFHEFNRLRRIKWPLSLDATSTHDTKRGEDVRARLNVISELPSEWTDNVNLWAKLNADKKQRVNGEPAPDRDEEYYFYQTILGSFPWSRNEEGYAGRLREHMVKVLREAKKNSSWLSPNIAYEEAVTRFVGEVLGSPDFLDVFMPFQRKISFYGFFNTLSQTLLKATCPGIPDFYQGTELWDLSLVDPDNRRPVNFETRKKILSEICGLNSSRATGFLAAYADGKAKFYVTYKALEFRRGAKELFAEGSYLPLAAKGVCQENILAFARQKQNQSAVAVAPRFLTGLLNEVGSWVDVDWADTAVKLPNDNSSLWVDVFTGRTLHSQNGCLPVGEVLGAFPVALLVAGGVDA